MCPTRFAQQQKKVLWSIGTRPSDTCLSQATETAKCFFLLLGVRDRGLGCTSTPLLFTDTAVDWPDRNGALVEGRDNTDPDSETLKPRSCTDCSSIDLWKASSRWVHSFGSCQGGEKCKRRLASTYRWGCLSDGNLLQSRPAKPTKEHAGLEQIRSMTS